MTVLVPNFDDALVVREADAEVLGLAPLSTRLLADSNVTGGALSIMRTTMGEGIEGARPHTHSKSAELFYLLDGQLQLLAGDQVITASKGDLVVVPPDMAHAFATPPGHAADFLIVQAPRAASLRILPAHRAPAPWRGDAGGTAGLPGVLRQPFPGQSRLADCPRVGSSS